MGVYYRFTCHARREYIDLEATTGAGRKASAAILAGPVVAFAMMVRWWGEDVRASNDDSDDWCAEDERGYRDVSAEVIRQLVVWEPWVDGSIIRDGQVSIVVEDEQ